MLEIILFYIINNKKKYKYILYIIYIIIFFYFFFKFQLSKGLKNIKYKFNLDYYEIFSKIIKV